MWQVILGIYLIISILIGIFLWSSLVLAKKSDNKTESHYRSTADVTVKDKVNPIDDQLFQLPNFSQPSKR